MRGFLKAMVAAVVLGSTGMAVAQDLIPERRFVVTQDQDLPGGDVASVFDTTIEACERACLTNARCTGYVFNTNNGSCFVKNNPGEG
ncbi:MAG: PAN/Apple domain-containing protein, partial [Pseudomonadota bacterium]